MKIQYALIIQFIKFSLIGLINVVVDWGIFLILTSFVYFFSIQSNEIYAKIISFIFAVTNSFVLNSLWTFKEEFLRGFKQNSKSKIQISSRYYIKFLIVNLVGLVLSMFIFNFLRPIFGQILPIIWARISTLAVVTSIVVIWNFSANKFWTFRVKKN